MDKINAYNAKLMDEMLKADDEEYLSRPWGHRNREEQIWDANDNRTVPLDNQLGVNLNKEAVKVHMRLEF